MTNNFSTDKRDKFWLKDYKVLYSDSRYLDFLPSTDMSRIEQLNSVTRFSIYFLILLILFGKKDKWFFLPIIAIIFAIFLYYVYMNDESGRIKEHKKLLEYRQNKLVQEDMLSKDISLEVGLIDSNGNIQYGGPNKAPIYSPNKKNLYTYEEMEDFRKNTCRKPTNDNAFMNPLVSDYGTEGVPEACNADDENIKEEINNKFNDNLYRNVSDVFNIESSQRQFYTIPERSNDGQQNFAKWLYGVPATCKEDNAQCIRTMNEDLRYASTR